jgi:hypothetical protein
LEASFSFTQSRPVVWSGGPVLLAERPEGWEERFAAVLREASRREFDVNTWNCGLFVKACVEAILCRPMPSRLSRTMERTVDRHFSRTERAQARRGDVVLAHLPGPTLGVCTGATAAFVDASGLTEIPMSRVLIAWKVE